MNPYLKRYPKWLFHIEKDLAHRIRYSGREKDLDMAKRLIKYMFFQNEKNLWNLGKNSDHIPRIITGRNEKQIVEIMLDSLMSLYGDGGIIAGFFSFMKRYRIEVFLYLQDPMLENTSDIAEQYFSSLYSHGYSSTGSRQRKGC